MYLVENRFGAERVNIKQGGRERHLSIRARQLKKLHQHTCSHWHRQLTLTIFATLVTGIYNTSRNTRRCPGKFCFKRTLSLSIHLSLFLSPLPLFISLSLSLSPSLFLFISLPLSLSLPFSLYFSLSSQSLSLKLDLFESSGGWASASLCIPLQLTKGVENLEISLT